MKRTDNVVACAVFFGALWGIAEATIGQLFHIMPLPGIAGFIMFPVGFYFMSRAYAHTKAPTVILGMAPVAAGLKMLDLFWPSVNYMATIKPVLCILLESLVIFVLYHALQRSDVILQWTAALGASLGWRTAYLALLTLLPAGWLGFSVADTSGTALAKFVLLDGLVNSILILLIARFHQKSFSREHFFMAIRPATAILALILAVTVEFFI